VDQPFITQSNAWPHESGDQSPAYFRPATIGGVVYCQFVLRNGTVIANVPASQIRGPHRDLCLIQSLVDSNGRAILVIAVLTLKGIQAGSLWFVENVMANPSLYAPWTADKVTVTGNNDRFMDFAEIQKVYP